MITGFSDLIHKVKNALKNLPRLSYPSLNFGHGFQQKIRDKKEVTFFIFFNTLSTWFELSLLFVGASSSEEYIFDGLTPYSGFLIALFACVVCLNYVSWSQDRRVVSDTEKVARFILKISTITTGLYFFFKLYRDGKNSLKDFKMNISEICESTYDLLQEAYTQHLWTALMNKKVQQEDPESPPMLNPPVVSASSSSGQEQEASITSTGQRLEDSTHSTGPEQEAATGDSEIEFSDEEDSPVPKEVVESFLKKLLKYYRCRHPSLIIYRRRRNRRNSSWIRNTLL